MSKRLLKSLLLKSAFIQKKIDEEQKARSKDLVFLMRLQKLRLKIAERIYAVAQGVLMPVHQPVLVPVQIKRRK